MDINFQLKAFRNIFLFSIPIFVGSVHATSTSPDQPARSVPLAQRILDQAPPENPFEYSVLDSQFNEMGFHGVAARIRAYGELRALEKATGQSVTKVATLRAVAADDSVERLLARQARRTVEDFTISFTPAVVGRDTIASMRQIDRTSLKKLVELAPGLWGVSEEKDRITSPSHASRFFFMASGRNRSYTKANVRFTYELPGGAPLNCAIDQMTPQGGDYSLCTAILIGTHMTKEGRRSVALTPMQKTSIFETLRSLQQGNLILSPSNVHLRFPELHLEIQVAENIQITMDQDWRFSAEKEARRRLRAVSCEDIGTCSGNMLAVAWSPSGLHAAITAIFMICLITYQFIRGGSARKRTLWPSILKIYAIVLLLAVAVNIGDSTSGATRGTPLNGTLGFLAKVAVSMPWSYYFVIEESDPGAPAGSNDTAMPDTSPWFWGFALINLTFLMLMVLGRKDSAKISK